MAEHLEKLLRMAEALQLSGEALQSFLQIEIDDDRDRRALRREELKLESERMKIDEQQIQNDTKRLELDESFGQKKLDQENKLETEKLELEKEKLEIKKAQEADRKLGNLGKSKLPMFDPSKDQFDAYISRFESCAVFRGWDRNNWAFQLSLLLTGKALETYDSLTVQQQGNYDTVKEALFRSFAFTEEEFRKRFYSCQPEGNETASQFGVRLHRLFNRWIDCTKIGRTFLCLSDLLVREQILRRCHGDLAAFLRERKYECYEDLCKVAETYIDAHGGNIKDPKGKRKAVQPSSTQKPKEAEKTHDKGEEQLCKYCKKSGHDVSECWRIPTADGKKKCFVCGADDHLIASCPKKTTSFASFSNFSCFNPSNFHGLEVKLSEGKFNGRNIVSGILDVTP